MRSTSLNPQQTVVAQFMITFYPSQIPLNNLQEASHLDIFYSLPFLITGVGTRRYGLLCWNTHINAHYEMWVWLYRDLYNLLATPHDCNAHALLII